MPDHVDRYELLAQLFRRETGFMAPGKDEPLVMNSVHTQEERRAAWEHWLERRALDAVTDDALKYRAIVDRIGEVLEDA